MPNPQNNYPDHEALHAFVQKQEKGFILVTYRNCEDYEGMALCIIIRFDTRQSKYDLDLEWMSLGLDLYGDTLQESYVYGFESLEKLLAHLLSKYEIAVTDIPVKYSFDSSQFPNPIYHSAKGPDFEVAWKRFQQDFKSGAFLDPSLKLVYSSSDQ